MSEAIVQRATRMLELTAVETLQGNPGSAGTTVQNNQFNIGPQNFTPSSAIPVSADVYLDETIVALTGSLVDIDLTNCPGGAQDNINGTTKKVQRIVLINDGNAAITLGPGSATKYHLFGTDKTLDVPAKSGPESAWLDSWAPEGRADISGTVKLIAITGTAGQPYRLAIWFG
jgi:hypothetical protein